MTIALAYLALETTNLQEAERFYEETLQLEQTHTTEHETHYAVEPSTLILRTPDAPTQAGKHVHYAFTTSVPAYDMWANRLASDYDLTFHDFGSFQSMYLFDPDEHCVEISNLDTTGTQLNSIFEIVLEVKTIDDALPFFEALGFTPGDNDPQRPRVRLTSPTLDIELWEPHIGLADAKPGKHVDFGIHVSNPHDIVETLPQSVEILENTNEELVVQTPNGHRMTLLATPDQ